MPTIRNAARFKRFTGCRSNLGLASERWALNASPEEIAALPDDLRKAVLNFREKTAKQNQS